MDGLLCQVPAWCARLPAVPAVEQSDPGDVAAEDEVEFVDQVCSLLRAGVVGDAHGGEVFGDAAEQVVLAQIEVARRTFRSGTGAGVTVTATVRGPTVGTVRVHLPPAQPALESAREQVDALAAVGVGPAGAVPSGLDGLGGDEVLSDTNGVWAMLVEIAQACCSLRTLVRRPLGERVARSALVRFHT
nr:hypothetical protein [Saccharothrix australiensis]